MTTPDRPAGCREVVDRLYEYLDRELDSAVERAVRGHLAECAHCFALHRFEDAYRRFLEARAQAKGAPPELRRRILHHLLSGRDPEAP
jgi:anti-sigma factor (TIGR02949 family)